MEQSPGWLVRSHLLRGSRSRESAEDELIEFVVASDQTEGGRKLWGGALKTSMSS